MIRILMIMSLRGSRNMTNLVPRSPTVRRRGDLVKFDLRPGIRACPSSFVHRAEWPPDHSW